MHVCVNLFLQMPPQTIQHDVTIPVKESLIALDLGGELEAPADFSTSLTHVVARGDEFVVNSPCHFRCLSPSNFQLLHE